MKVLAILEVEKEMLRLQNSDIEKEMERIELPGLKVEQYLEISRGETNTEYAAFGFDVDKQEYVLLGRPVFSEVLCKNRLKEALEKGWVPESVDQCKIFVRKRKVVICPTEWEDIR